MGLRDFVWVGGPVVIAAVHGPSPARVAYDVALKMRPDRTIELEAQIGISSLTGCRGPLSEWLHLDLTSRQSLCVCLCCQLSTAVRIEV